MIPVQFSTERAAQLRALHVLWGSIEELWNVIANVDQGDWERQACDWQNAAAAARETYHRCLDIQNPDYLMRWPIGATVAFQNRPPNEPWSNGTIGFVVGNLIESECVVVSLPGEARDVVINPYYLRRLTADEIYERANRNPDPQPAEVPGRDAAQPERNGPAG